MALVWPVALRAVPSACVQAVWSPGSQGTCLGRRRGDEPLGGGGRAGTAGVRLNGFLACLPGPWGVYSGAFGGRVGQEEEGVSPLQRHPGMSQEERKGGRTHPLHKHGRQN